MTSVADYLGSQEAMRDLRALNALFIHNFITNDIRSHDAILHADFIGVQSDGSRISRADYLERWATGFDPDVIIYWDVRDEVINIVGNVALVRATNKHVMRHNGRDNTGMTTYTDIYLYANGRWSCIQAQITPIAPSKEPGDETVITVYVNGILQARPSGIAHGA